MRAEIVGIPPVPTGLTWVSGSIEFSFDPNWSDGAGRGPGTISGILQPTTKDKFVVPGSLGALFVPATPTGTGVIRGPLMSMRWSLIDSQGREYRVDSVFPDSLLADAGNLFNVNALGATPTYVTSAGPAPVGVDLATGDARYVRFTSVATTGASGIASLATDAEAIAGTVSTKSIVPTSLKAVLDLRLNVATVVALQGITAVQRAAGLVLANVIGIGIFAWDAASLRISNTSNVVRPTDFASDATAGRWIKVAASIGTLPTAPTMTYAYGVGTVGNLTVASIAVVASSAQFLAYDLIYTFAPGVSGETAFAFTVPSGYLIAAITPTATITGVETPLCFPIPTSNILVRRVNTGSTTISVRLTLMQIN